MIQMLDRAYNCLTYLLHRLRLLHDDQYASTIRINQDAFTTITSHHGTIDK